MKYITNVLVLAPHTDDGELGCGGTLARLIEEGVSVHYAAFSLAEKAVIPLGYPPNVLEAELKAAMSCLMVPQENIKIYHYDLRTFSYHRQEILDDMIALNKEIHPDLVFIPSLSDLHQDHRVIAEEGVRAYKHTSILSYEQPWNNISFSTQSFFKLEEHHIHKKIEALACYATQKYRGYLDPDFIKGLARTRGVQINTDYSEAFEVIRWIIS